MALLGAPAAAGLRGPDSRARSSAPWPGAARGGSGRPADMIHPTALVECDDLGAGTRVWAFAHILQGATVGEDCNIGGHCLRRVRRGHPRPRDREERDERLAQRDAR